MTYGYSLGARCNRFIDCRSRLLLAWLLVATVLATFVQAGPSGIQAYPLKHSQSDDVVPLLRKQLLELASDSKVYSNAQANQVLVQGSDETQQLAERLLKALDQPGGVATDPAARSREVKGYRVEGDLPTLIKVLQKRFPSSTGARISADERTKQVIVVAPDAIQRQIAQALQTHQAPTTDVRPEENPAAVNAQTGLSHELRHITWRDLEGELVRLWSTQLLVTRARNGELVNVSITGGKDSQPVMQIDRRTGEVSFTGSGESIAHWRKIVQAIDSPRDGEQQTQLVPIRYAEPGIVQSTVSFLNQMVEKPEDETMQAVPLSRSGRKRNAADLVAMLFQQKGEPAKAAEPQNPAPPTPPRPGQPPAAAQPPAAQPLPDQPAPNQPAPAAPGQEPAPVTGPVDVTDLGLMGPVTVEILNDTIIIRGNKRDVERVKRLIEDLDRLAVETQPKIEVFQLQHINADAATVLVTELYTEILQERTGQVSIRSLSEPNAILLIGREESVNVVKSLIEKLDQPSPPASRFEVFRLKHMSALDAEQTIRNFFVNRPGTDTNLRAGIGARVQVIAEARTNTLIVQASPRDMEEVRRLIENIDVTETGTSAELRVFKLKNALADTLAAVLQAAISGQATTGGQQPGVQGQQQPQQGGTTTQGQPRLPPAALEFMMIDQEGGKLLRSGILTDVQVTADANNNSLIVRAPASSMELIAALIEQLDKLPDASAQVKVFTIVNGNATSLAQMLQQLFGQQVTAGQGTQNTSGLLGGFGQQLQTATGGGDSSLVPLRFAIDQRTNSIIASGSEGDLQVVETILLRLDESLDDRRLSVVRLRNTQASSVATAIQQYLTNLQQQVQQQLLSNQSISAFESVERQVFVIPENVTNSLIVSATPRFQEEILNVIKELDVRPPMVMVQVLIAEVLLSDTFEFGSELGFQDSLVFDRGKAVGSPPGSQNQSIPGFNFNPSDADNALSTTAGLTPGGYPNVRSYQQEALAGQSLTNFALGRSSAALPYSGLVLSAASESINILLRALQDEQRLQILSRPQIMTMHNQPAFVQVGANVGRPGPTTITAGVAQTSVNYVDTGLILSILPLINDDGVIVMGIEAQNSVLGPENDPNATELETGENQTTIIKPLNITQASTTISARDGQTVVFAGLITKQNEVQLRRVPYLSDIPVLGNLFKFQSNSETRRELLVVMTPHLVRSEEDVERIKTEESARMSWCLADVVNITGEWGLQGNNCGFCNSDAPLIFPDVDPTGTMGEPVPTGPPTPPLPPPPAPLTTPAPNTNSQSMDYGPTSGRRNSQRSTDDEPAFAPVTTDEASLRPSNSPYGSPPKEISPATYRVVRLPSPR